MAVEVGRLVQRSVDSDHCATPALFADALRNRLILFKRLLAAVVMAVAAALMLQPLFASGSVAVKTAGAAALSADVIADRKSVV